MSEEKQQFGEANLIGLTASNQHIIAKPLVGPCLEEERHIYKLMQSLRIAEERL